MRYFIFMLAVLVMGMGFGQQGVAGGTESTHFSCPGWAGDKFSCELLDDPRTPLFYFGMSRKKIPLGSNWAQIDNWHNGCSYCDEFSYILGRDN